MLAASISERTANLTTMLDPVLPIVYIFLSRVRSP